MSHRMEIGMERPCASSIFLCERWSRLKEIQKGECWARIGKGGASHPGKSWRRSSASGEADNAPDFVAKMRT